MADFADFSVARFIPELSCRIVARPIGFVRHWFPFFRVLPFMSGHAITVAIRLEGKDSDKIRLDRFRFISPDDVGKSLKADRQSWHWLWRKGYVYTVSTPWLGKAGANRIDADLVIGQQWISEDVPSMIHFDLLSSDKFSLAVYTFLLSVVASAGGAFLVGRMTRPAMPNPLPVIVVSPTPFPTPSPTETPISTPGSQETGAQS